MKVLLLGSGGREHALAWKLSLSLQVEKVYVAPGNAGTEGCDPKICNIAISQRFTFDDILQHVHQLGIDLVLPSPESHFADGIWDHLTLNGVSCLGPSKAAAQLESSKRFAKRFVLRHNIPTPKSWTCNDLNMVRQVLEDNQDWPIVVKASGLTAGKGVFLAMTRAEALQKAADILSIYECRDHGARSPCLLLEAYHAGPFGCQECWKQRA